MSELDWDLSAVVRSCRSSSSVISTTTTPPPPPPSSSSSKDVPLPLVKQENDVFSFPSLIQPASNGFQELHKLLRPYFIPTPTPTITTTTTATISTSGCGIYPKSSFTDFAVPGSSSRNNTNTSASSYYAPHLLPQASPTTSLPPPGFQRFQKQLVHQNQQLLTPPGQITGRRGHTSDMPLPNTHAAQTLNRSRKRRSQQRRMVCHVSTENLTADTWAWRKYGQKPIKGSPYPRNYYRCSSTKGCGARKQVERSYTEQDMFIVTYTGEHTHPLPTHRNSMAGSTRNKPSTMRIRQPDSHESGSPSTTINPASSSSNHQLSPTTPLTAVTANDDCAADEAMISNNEAMSPLPEYELDFASDDDILIPNMAVDMVDRCLLVTGEIHGGIGLSGGGGYNTSGNPADGSYPKTDPD